MTVELYLAPTAAGKTTFILELAREAAHDLHTDVRLCTATSLQAFAARRRLAVDGGTIGVRVSSFEQLVAECLNAAGIAYTELSEPVQFRLIRLALRELPLDYYAPLTAYPGFVQAVRDLIRELKAALVRPQEFASAVSAIGDPPRLKELARIYAAYQERLISSGWADAAGLTWLAIDALKQAPSPSARDWPLLLVDGFDRFTPAQLDLLSQLAGYVGRLVITLTGHVDESKRFRLFQETRNRLEATFDVTAGPLPGPAVQRAPVLEHLASRVFEPAAAAPTDGGTALTLLEAPNQAAEVRAALRWLKARIVLDQAAPGDTVLLARNMAPYGENILQVAEEFGLPVRLVEGRPLAGNPAVAALVNLLSLVRPLPGAGGPALPPGQVVTAWRSPYFNWAAHVGRDEPQPIGITREDAMLLDKVARHSRVIAGYDQWQSALQALSAQKQAREFDRADEPAAAPQGGGEAKVLLEKLDRFRRRLTPPAAAGSMRDFAGWLEKLIGPDPEHDASKLISEQPEPSSLNVVAMARQGPAPEAERDIAALQALKEVLRGLVWAEEAAGLREFVDYPAFFSELLGAIEASTYHLPSKSSRDEILVANMNRARGLSFKAAAVLGLAEGSYPAVIREDPFLRDADRLQLRRESGLPLDLSTTSDEQESFYESLGRARERLLLTRPRLDDSGAEWVPSPFWAEVRRIVAVDPLRPSDERTQSPAEAASWPELLSSFASAAGEEQAAVVCWVEEMAPDRLAALNAAAEVLRHRRGRHLGVFDGGLSALADHFAVRFGPDTPWSASRVEAYRTCPHFFFVSSVLGLEPRAEPVEGLDARQLGNIYHRILEALYRDDRLIAESDKARIEAAVNRIARPVLDAAPETEGFRATQWWVQTQAEILSNITRSVMAMAEMAGEYRPVRTEGYFDNLEIEGGDEGGGPFLLKGLIDRVDRDPAGQLRIIDYKTGGPSSYDSNSLSDGRRLQLPLYALAAQEALLLGRAADGFYWHCRHAVASPLLLSKFRDGGVAGALETAVHYARLAVNGAREGDFAPRPPDSGCPDYCPAAGYCWHYREGRGGRA